MGGGSVTFKESNILVMVVGSNICHLCGDNSSGNGVEVNIHGSNRPQVSEQQGAPILLRAFIKGSEVEMLHRGKQHTLTLLYSMT